MWYQSLLSVLKSVDRYRSIVQALLKFNTYRCDKASNALTGNKMTTPLLSALTVAKHILARMEERSQPVNNLKLQKLLYYTQAWYLGFYGVPLFHERIQAWAKGPVVPVVFQRYKHYGYMNIRNSPTDAIEPLPPEVSEHLNDVLDAYAHYSGSDLSTMTHVEDPWTEARKGLEDAAASNRVISNDTMKRYYSNRVNE